MSPSSISCTVRAMMDFAGFFEEAADLVHGVGGEVEGDEEALGAVLAGHDGLEGVDVGSAGWRK